MMMRSSMPARPIGVASRSLSCCMGVAVLLLLATGGSRAQSVTSPLAPAIAEVDRLAAAELARDGLAGVTIGVVQGEALVWTGSYGLADMDAKRPATADTVYRIGSITKQLTAVALLQLVERGTVSLTDPVEKHFPEVTLVPTRFAGGPITLLQLATMTSGLAREPDDLPTFLEGPVASWERVLVKALARTTYAYPPGTRYHYSNIGYAVLGAAIARAAGRPFVDVVRDGILVPLGMSRTVFEPDAGTRASLATGYAIGRDGVVDAETPAREHAGRGYKVPNGALYTTVGDLARFVAFELGHGPAGILGEEARDLAAGRVYSADEDLRSGYGLGVQVVRRGELVLRGHGGSVAGYEAAAWAAPREGIGVIVLRNAGGGAFRVRELCFEALALLAAAAGSR